MRLVSWFFEIVDCGVVEPLETCDCDQFASRVVDLPNRVSAISGGPSVSQANNRGACSRVRDVYRWRVVVHLIPFRLVIGTRYVQCFWTCNPEHECHVPQLKNSQPSGARFLFMSLAFANL